MQIQQCELGVTEVTQRNFRQPIRVTQMENAKCLQWFPVGFGAVKFGFSSDLVRIAFDACRC